MAEKRGISPRPQVLLSTQEHVQGRNLSNEFVNTVEYVKTSKPGSKDVYEPHEFGFDSPESFSEFFVKPCERKTVARLIHARNSPWVLEEIEKYTGRQYKELAEWMKQPILASRPQEKVWVPKLSAEYNDLQFGYEFFSTNWEAEHKCHRSRQLDSMRYTAEGTGESRTMGICLKKLAVIAFSMKKRFPGDHPLAIVLIMEDTQGCPSDFFIPVQLDVPANTDRHPADASLRALDHILYWVLRSTGNAWWNIVRCHQAHFILIEQEIFRDPVDEDWGDTLWRLSNNWSIYNRALNLQLTMMTYLKRRVEQYLDAHYRSWLDMMTENYPGGHAYGSLSRSSEIKVFGSLDKMFAAVQSELNHALIVPTTNLLDMIYKRVAIRDAQNSLKLNESLWRLSWITFIFLPLTFLCGFFGMNVNTFSGNPDIKWWFIAAVPLMVIVFVLWFVFRRVQDASGKRKNRDRLLELDPSARV